jgi:hypothetical protein
MALLLLINKKAPSQWEKAFCDRDIVTETEMTRIGELIPIPPHPFSGEGDLILIFAFV